MVTIDGQQNQAFWLDLQNGQKKGHGGCHVPFSGRTILPGQKLVIALPFLKQGTLVKAEIVWRNDEGIGIKFKRRKKR